MTENLLEIKNLTKIYGKADTGFVAIRDFNLTLPKKPASIVTIAGESGSGKSTLANLVLGFTKPTSGKIQFGDFDLVQASAKEMRSYHRNVVQAIFQDPFGVYNPFYRVKSVFDKTIKNFKLAGSKSEGDGMIEEALNVVGLKSADILFKYPHQLSGGQRQRIVIALALACRPQLIIADEPTTALDAVTQKQILDLLDSLIKDTGVSLILISHNLEVISYLTEKMMVMYAGRNPETLKVKNLQTDFRHPYTKGLVNSSSTEFKKGEKLPTIPGRVPELSELLKGCPFQNRCERKSRKCEIDEPSMTRLTPEHFYFCHNPLPQ